MPKLVTLDLFGGKSMGDCPVYIEEGEEIVCKRVTRDCRIRKYQCIDSLPIRSLGVVESWRRAGLEKSENFWILKSWNARYLLEETPIAPAVMCAYLLDQIWTGVKDPLIQYLKEHAKLAVDLHGNSHGVRYLRPKQGPLSAHFVVGNWYYACSTGDDDRVALVLVTKKTKLKIGVQQVMESSPAPWHKGHGTRKLQKTVEFEVDLYIGWHGQSGEYFCIGWHGQSVKICSHNHVQAGSACWE